MCVINILSSLGLLPSSMLTCIASFALFGTLSITSRPSFISPLPSSQQANNSWKDTNTKLSVWSDLENAGVLCNFEHLSCHEILTYNKWAFIIHKESMSTDLALKMEKPRGNMKQLLCSSTCLKCIYCGWLKKVSQSRNWFEGTVQPKIKNTYFFFGFLFALCYLST